MLWKNGFVIFDPKKFFSNLGSISEKSVKIVKKCVYYLLVPKFMDTVKNFCDHSMTLRETTDYFLTTGHFWTPPASLRVNEPYYMCQVKLKPKLKNRSRKNLCWGFFVPLSLVEPYLYVNRLFLIRFLKTKRTDCHRFMHLRSYSYD